MEKTAQASNVNRLTAHLLTEYVMCNDDERVFWELLFPFLSSDNAHPEYRALRAPYQDLVFLVENDQVSYYSQNKFKVLVKQPAEDSDASLSDLLIECLVEKFDLFLVTGLGRVGMTDDASISGFYRKICAAIEAHDVQDNLMKVLVTIQSWIRQYQANFPYYLVTDKESTDG